MQCLQLCNQLVALLDPRNSITNQLVNNSLGALLLIHNSRCLAHQERSCVIHGLVINVVTCKELVDFPIIRVVLLTQSLKVVLDRNNSLACKLLNLSSTVLFPVGNISVVSYTERSASKDDCADVVVVASSSDSLLVSLWRTSLISQDEAGTYPNSGSAKHKSSSNSLAIVDTTGSNDLHRCASHRAGLAFAEVDDSWDQNCCGNIASVSTSLTTLCANDVDAKIEALLDVLWVADHVRVEYAGLVEALDDMFGWNTNGGDEELGATVDDDAHELVKFALSIVIAVLIGLSACAQLTCNHKTDASM
jgi:hypothetical protein